MLKLYGNWIYSITTNCNCTNRFYKSIRVKERRAYRLLPCHCNQQTNREMSQLSLIRKWKRNSNLSKKAAGALKLLLMHKVREKVGPQGSIVCIERNFNHIHIAPSQQLCLSNNESLIAELFKSDDKHLKSVSIHVQFVLKAYCSAPF